MKHAFRLLPGQDIRRELERYAKNHSMTAGFIVTCVGSTSSARLRMAGAKRFKTFSGNHEIVSLVGTVSIHGCHLHLAISNDEGVVFGGHLSYETIIGTTAEIVMNEVAGSVFRRKPDPDTGYDELVIEDSA